MTSTVGAVATRSIRIDPAAAPLGTDDEAAGTPPSPAAISQAHDHEIGSAPAHPKGMIVTIRLLLISSSFARLPGTWPRIVGTDEGDPRRGTLSYASPLARALMGKEIGDAVVVAGHEEEIIEVA
jgi:hypothetical protein